MIYLGLDPGAGGGIAALTVLAKGTIEVSTFPMPATEADILELLKRLEWTNLCHAALEHVWSIPGQGGAFAFGRNVGHLEMALTAAKIPFDKVLPKAWQKSLGITYAKGLTNTEKKNITKRRAQQLFPALTITHAIADALLLAEYCRRLHRGLHGKEERKDPAGKSRAEDRRRPATQRGESREEFERDRFGETGERLSQASHAKDQRPGKRADVPGAGRPQGRRPDAPREGLRR